MEQGVYQDSRWSNPDLDPIKPEMRTWGALVCSHTDFRAKADCATVGLLGVLDF